MMENWAGAEEQVTAGQGFAGEADSRDGVQTGIDIMAIAEVVPVRVGRRRKAGRPHGDIQEAKGQKRRGELAEAMFLIKVAAMGFSVMTPWGDSDKYDLVVDTGRRMVRVQVKSAHRVSANRGGGYHVRAHGHERRPYRASEIDLLVACVVPEDAWYVFPPRAFEKMKSMRLFPRPGKKISKFEKYREAWGWFEDRR